MKNRNHSLSKSAISTVITQIPTQLFGIIAGIFITRMLGPEGRGLYAIFHADISLLSTILGFSISNAIVQFHASRRISEEKLITISLFFSFITILLCLLVLGIWINSPFAHLFYPESEIGWQIIVLFILFVSFTQLNTVYSSFFQGAREFNVVNKVSIINSIINLIVFATMYYLDEIAVLSTGINGILFLGAAVLIINSLLWHYHFRKRFPVKMNLGIKWKSEIKPFFQFSGLGHVSNVINFFNYRLVLWIIAYYLDNAEVGIFSLAVGLTQLLGFISTPLSQVLMPFLSAENSQERTFMFLRFSRIHFAIMLLFCLIALVLSPIFIPLLYGSEFSRSVIAFNYLLFGALLSNQTRVFASYLIANDQLKYNLYATILGFSITFLSNVYFVKWYGINGAAIAQTITYSGIFLFVYIAIYKFTNVNSLNLFTPGKTEFYYAWNKLRGKSEKSS